MNTPLHGHHQDAPAALGMAGPSLSPPTTGSPPTDASGMPNSTPSSGILPSQLSWGPRPALNLQLRSNPDLRSMPMSQVPIGHEMGHAPTSQPHHPPAMAAMGMYGTATPNTMTPAPLAHHQQTAPMAMPHPQSVPYPMHQHHDGVASSSVGGNVISGPSAETRTIFESTWPSAPTLQTARDFALNFQGSTGVWHGPMSQVAGSASHAAPLPPSGCLVAAAATNGGQGIQDHMMHPNHMAGHQGMMHMPSTSTRDAPSFAHAPPHQQAGHVNGQPQTPMTPAALAYATNEAQAPGGADPAFMNAMFPGAARPSLTMDDRRASMQSMAHTPGSSNAGVGQSNGPGIIPSGLAFAPIASPTTPATTSGLPMQPHLVGSPWTQTTPQQGPASSLPTSMVTSFLQHSLEPNFFAPLGESLNGIHESMGTPLTAPGSSSANPMGSASANNALLATTQISSGQLSMTDPFHAVSLELWRQLGYNSSQTYGILGGDSVRNQGGAMILDPNEAINGADGGSEPHGMHGLGSAISLAGPGSGSVDGVGAHVEASGSTFQLGKPLLTAAGATAASSDSPQAPKADEDDDGNVDDAEEESLLGSDEDMDEDDGDDGEEPSKKAARLSAKKLRLHRRQGVTCDQCRSKHLRCDLSDRKFKAFEATLQRSLGLSRAADSSAHARQEAALAVQAEDEAKLDAAAAAKAAASGTPVVLNNPIRCTRCEKRGLVCTKSYNPPSKRNPRPGRTGKRIEQARQLHGTRPLGVGMTAPLTAREVALEDVFNMLTGETEISASQSTDARLYNRILASSINIRLLTTYFAVFHIQMPVIDFDNFCFRFNTANGDARKMAIMANGGDDEEGLPSAIPGHRNLIMPESSDPRDSTISTAGTVEALIAAMHLCAALYTDMPLIQPVNVKKLYRATTPGRKYRNLPSRADGSGSETVNSFILPHPKGSKEHQATEQAVEAAAAEAAGKQSNKRLKRKQGVACDSCRLRRVRCDLTERPKGASCTRCEDKKINCTAEYIESIRAKGKTVVLDVVHAKAEAVQENRARDREVSKRRMAAAAAAAAAAVVSKNNGSTDGSPDKAEGSVNGSEGDGAAGALVVGTRSDLGDDPAAVAAAAAAVAAAAAEEDEDEEDEEGSESDGERALERAQERWVRSGAIGAEFGRLRIADAPESTTTMINASNASLAGQQDGSVDAQRSTSRDVDMGGWARVSPQVPDTVDLVHQKDMLQWGRARQGLFKKLKERAIELVYRHDLLHRPSTEAVQTLMILSHILYAVDPVQVKLFASVALKHIKALNLQTRHEVYEQDQEAVEHLLTDMQASRVYLTSWTRDGIMSGMYRMEPNFPEERTIQVKGGQRPFDPSDQLKDASISGAVQSQNPQPVSKELSGQMGLTFSIMAMTQIGALSRFVAKHIDRTEGVPAGASATDRFPLLPTPGDMKKLSRVCNAVWQGTDALLQFFDKCAARSRENMERLKPFQPLPWIAMLKMCGAMLDLAVYRVLSERYGVNAAYMAAITRQIQMSNGKAVNPKIRALSEEDFEQARILRALFEKGRNRAMIRSRRTAHLAAFLLRKNVFQFGGVIMRQFFAVSQFLARMPCEDAGLAAIAARERAQAASITTLENTPQQAGSPVDGVNSNLATPPPSVMGAESVASSSRPASVRNGHYPSDSTDKGPMAMRFRPSSPSSISALSQSESNYSSNRTTASIEGESHVPWYVGARELGPFDAAAKKREVGWCLEAMAQIGYAWPDMELKIASVEAIMRSEGLMP